VPEPTTLPWEEASKNIKLYAWRVVNNVFPPYRYTDIATFTYRHKTRHCYFSHRERHVSAVLGVQGETDILY
jgi:hypothetical protein